jgi:hypothetical protein
MKIAFLAVTHKIIRYPYPTRQILNNPNSVEKIILFRFGDALPFDILVPYPSSLCCGGVAKEKKKKI